MGQVCVFYDLMNISEMAGRTAVFFFFLIFLNEVPSPVISGISDKFTNILFYIFKNIFHLMVNELPQPENKL